MGIREALCAQQGLPQCCCGEGRLRSGRQTARVTGSRGELRVRKSTLPTPLITEAPWSGDAFEYLGALRPFSFSVFLAVPPAVRLASPFDAHPRKHRVLGGECWEKKTVCI